MIFKDVYTFLALDAPLTVLVGTNIYVDVIAEGKTTPAITYVVRQVTDDFLLNSTNGSLQVADLEVNCWDLSAITAHSIAEAVITALVGYSGAFGDATVKQIAKIGESDMPYELDTKRHGVSLAFQIHFI